MTLRQELRMTRQFSSPEEELNLNLQRTVGLLSRPMLQFLKTHGLSPAQYNILRILRGQPDGSLPCRQIGLRMVTREPDVTRLLDRLEKDGLVTRLRSDADRRVVRISITAAGQSLLTGLDEPMRAIHKESLGHLTRADIRELNRLLVKARQPFLEEENDD
jgi:DNA-binding MarR family transcriptional regulator